MHDTIPRGSIERKLVEVTTSADPSSTDPDWAITVNGATPSTWVAGAWADTWDPATTTISALSPPIGDGGQLDTTGLDGFDLHVRWAVGLETPIRHVARIILT